MINKHVIESDLASDEKALGEFSRREQDINIWFKEYEMIRITTNLNEHHQTRLLAIKLR